MPAMNDPPKCRWYQFSLRELMIAITVAAIACPLGISIRDWQTKKVTKESLRAAIVAADVAKYEFLKTKEAYDKVTNSVSYSEVKRLSLAWQTALAHVAELKSEIESRKS